MRSSWLFALVAIGCAEVHPREVGDAGEPIDASPRDAGEASSDAGGGGMDAAVSDAAPGDAGWIGTPCMVGSAAGTCELVSECTGDRAPSPGHCPGPTEIQCCTPFTMPATDGGWACDPDDAPTPNEGLSEEPGDPGCPDAMVRVGTFCIDRFEASLVLVDADGAAIGSWSPYHNPGAHRVRAVSLRGAVPQAYVDGTRSAAACREAGKRLCSNTEWLRACRGPSGTTYPYGDTRLDGVCNDARAVHPAVQRFGTSASWIWSALGDACIDQLPDSLATTDAHPGCVTSEGALDMMGNLHEWTADPAGTFRGGFYVDTYRNGDGCLYATTAHDVSHWDYSTGFRCCADAR